MHNQNITSRLLVNTRIGATIPVTTVTCERSFSTLSRVKSYLRSTTGYRDVPLNPKEILNKLTCNKLARLFYFLSLVRVQKFNESFFIIPRITLWSYTFPSLNKQMLFSVIHCVHYLFVYLCNVSCYLSLSTYIYTSFCPRFRSN